MRRFLWVCAVAISLPFLVTPARAQFQLRREPAQADSRHASANHQPPAAPPRPATPAAPVRPHWVPTARLVPRVPAMAGGSAPAPSNPSAAVPRQHHHQHWSGYPNANFYLYGAAALPYYWTLPYSTGGYTPAFASYYPIYPYLGSSVVATGISVVNPNVPPLGFNNPANNGGVGGNFAGGPLPQPRNLDPIDRPDPPKPKVRSSTAEQKAKAGKLIATGDANFSKQQYFPALERYKSAAQLAPDVAEPFFRQAHAMLAVGQYENAAKAFRRGLKIRGDWNGSPFRINQLYGDAQVAKEVHFESLAKALETNPLDANLLVDLGLQLFFDGQRERGLVFLTRAAQLGGNADHLLDAFLNGKVEAQAAQKDDGQEAKIVF
jgi:tetratricopeptide (TPR) repeat protein